LCDDVGLMGTTGKGRGRGGMRAEKVRRKV